MLQTISQNTWTDLEESISRAMSQVNAKKETDLCNYLPGKNGRLHHFAFGKLKKTRPTELQKMIKEHILEKETPKAFSSKPRADFVAKRLVELKFKQSQVKRLIDILRKSGDQELISMFSPHQTCKQVQKLMVEMIRTKDVDQELWETYVKLVNEERSVLQRSHVL